MRLLNVSSLVFQEFHHPNVPPYAIASHRWGPGAEVKLHEFQSGEEKDSSGYRKVVGFAKYAERHIPAMQWLWIDTCCINQDSSQEVSESINSMFRWYRDAKICLAYLQDVPTTKDAAGFRRSEWFERGWTLQELLAPKLVLFLARDWTVIGHKGRMTHGDIEVEKGILLDNRIAAITQIPEAILQDYEQSHEWPVADKLQWVRNRRTTREEDYWYCLLGICGVSMTIRYGDGRETTRERFFRKLQKRDEALDMRELSEAVPRAGLAPTTRTSSNAVARAVSTSPSRPTPETASLLKATLRPSSNAPARRDPHFVERVLLTDQIHTIMEKSAARRVALVGPGGVGKTQLAIGYAHQLRQRSPLTWVFWFSASNRARFDQSLRHAADLLDLPGRTDPAANFLPALRNALASGECGPWLVVLDDVDDAGFLLEPFMEASETAHLRPRFEHFPICEHGSMIITSSNETAVQQLFAEPAVLDVGPMNEEEAVVLLESQLGQASKDDRRLVRSLDCLPLAIAQAAAFLRELTPQCSVLQYCDLVEQARVARADLLAGNLPTLPRDTRASSSAVLTWQISFDHLYAISRSAADLLSLMSFGDCHSIPEIVLRADGEKDDSPYAAFDEGLSDDEAEDDFSNGDTFEEDIIILRSFSLISSMGETQTWEMHRQVRDATQAWLRDGEKLNVLLERYIHRLYTSFPAARLAEYESLDWTLYRRLLPHVKSVAEQWWIPSRSAQLKWARITADCALYKKRQGHFASALTMSLASMEIRSEHLGRHCAETIASVALTADIFARTGRLQEAEEFQVAAVRTSTMLFGEKYPFTLKINDELAVTRFKQGRLEEAEALQVKVVKSATEVLGEDHIQTLKSQFELARTLVRQNRSDDAVLLLDKVTNTATKLLGEEHLLTLRSMIIRGLIFATKGSWVEAEDLQRRVMDLGMRVLEVGHPVTLESMTGLVATLSAQQKLPEAVAIQEQIMQRTEIRLGPEHPATLTSLHDLALLHYRAGKTREGHALMDQCIASRDRVLGSSHPDTKQSRLWRGLGNSALATKVASGQYVAAARDVAQFAGSVVKFTNILRKNLAKRAS